MHICFVFRSPHAARSIANIPADVVLETPTEAHPILASLIITYIDQRIFCFCCDLQGLLSIHGKEHGMVEDTVSALDMLADFKLQVGIDPAAPTLIIFVGVTFAG